MKHLLWLGPSYLNLWSLLSFSSHRFSFLPFFFRRYVHVHSLFLFFVSFDTSWMVFNAHKTHKKQCVLSIGGRHHINADKSQIYRLNCVMCWMLLAAWYLLQIFLAINTLNLNSQCISFSIANFWGENKKKIDDRKMKANKVVQHSTMWRSASNAHSMNKHFAPYNFGIGCNECLVSGDKPTKNIFEYECKIVLPFTWLLFISCQQCG